jgi:hypothetical protein
MESISRLIASIALFALLGPAPPAARAAEGPTGAHQGIYPAIVLSPNAHGFSSESWERGRGEAYRVNPNSKLSGEVLSGTKVRLSYPHNVCPVLDVSIVNFIATGTATGPYPGIFKAKGQWSSRPGGYRRQPFTGLNEHFTIKSGAGIYTGSVAYSNSQHAYGNCTSISIQAHYRSTRLRAHGTTDVSISTGSFAEEFY